MTDRLKEAVNSWIDPADLSSPQLLPTTAYAHDNNSVVERAPMKHDVNLSLNIRQGQYSIFGAAYDSKDIYISWDYVPEDSQIHYNNHYELICVLDGVFQYNMIDRNELLHAGDFMIMDTHCIYWDKKVEQDSTVLYLALSPDFFLTLIDQLPDSSALSYLAASQLDTHLKEQRYVRFHTGENTELRFHTENILASILLEQKKTYFNYQKIIQIQAQRLLILLMEQGNPKEYKINNGRKESALLVQLEHYIMEHLADVSRQELSDIFHYNQQYFNRLMKKYYGTTLVQYIQKKRLSEAKRLLLYTTLPVHQIIGQTGYVSRRFFNQLFYEDTGLTPTDFRHHYQKTDQHGKISEK